MTQHKPATTPAHSIPKIRQWIRRNDLEIIAFLSGAVVLILEIVDARILAPYFGSSIYVWTSIIGTILAFLSLGYYHGGKLADRFADRRGLAILLTIAAATQLVTSFLYEPILRMITAGTSEVRISAFVASVMLFGPVNFLLGMVSPYVAKLKITSVKTAGSNIGSLYAASTAGSILGTFLAGYWLIAYFGSRSLCLAMVAILIGVTFIADRKAALWPRLLILSVATFFASNSHILLGQKANVVLDTDTAYTRTLIVDEKFHGRPARILYNDGFARAQSGMYLDGSKEMPFSYQKVLQGVADTHPDPKNILLIGGGAFTYASDFTARYPTATIDVVEIDPAMPGMSQKYFGFKPNPRITIITEDGRVYLNRATELYDLIIFDAFGGNGAPFQLVSREAFSRARLLLKPGGMVAVNSIAAPQGDSRPLLTALRATLAEQFTYVDMFRTSPQSPLHKDQNVVFAASDTVFAGKWPQLFTPMHYTLPASDAGIVFTDDYAPIEHYAADR